MPTTEHKSILATAAEKPAHYRYLKEFRVEQCPLFPQHKCTQHRPFTCFNWHFPNQRRRRPVRKRDGTFNYSPDNYCSKYDETLGACPDGDDCTLLHRTAGDTERRYHLRYFKTCMCVYETDSRGFCVKNGAHCAFAHGETDKRPPVYDIRELQATNPENQPEPEVINGPNPLDKERNMMVDDPKWQDANYVLVCYKTEQCKRPPRLCRQGYACPQYHNLRDRRRSPKKYKYRSTPCPNVKHGDEWGEPSSCDDGDDCPYCHTRTEQQFHPEIYKSSKCNDVFANQYCPRGPFCAFAHAGHEMSINRNLPTDTNFGEILSGVLPPGGKGEGNNNGNGMNGNGVGGGAGGGDTPSSASSSTLHGGYFNNTMQEFSDVLLTNSCGSPMDYGTAVSFGAQSFASAVGGGVGTKFYDDNHKTMGDVKNQNGGMSFYENFDNILSFNNLTEDRDAYSLFPSNLVALKSHGMCGDRSPSTIDKDLEDHFPSGSKPVSIPTLFGRERFPSGSSLTGSLNNSFSIGPLFGGNKYEEKKGDPFGSSIFEYSREGPSPTTSNSNGFNNGGPGPIGPSPSSSIALNGFNGNSFLTFMSRSDLNYYSTELMAVYLNQCKVWMDHLSKGLQAATNKDHPNYPCLNCKSPDRPRTVLVLPCEHQVLCAHCGPMVRSCPRCGSLILNRKTTH